MENVTDISDRTISMLARDTFREQVFMLHVLTFLQYQFKYSRRAEEVQTLRP